MTEIQGTQLVDHFHRDNYSSPYIDISGDYLIIELDISSSETQVFLYRQSDKLLFLENRLWEKSQISLVNRALQQLAFGKCSTIDIYNKIFLAGVWHFGHFIGDHSHHLLSSYIHSIHISGSSYFINELYSFVQDLHEHTLENISTPSSLPFRIYRPHNCRCFFRLLISLCH